MNILEVLRELKWADSICVTEGQVCLAREGVDSVAIARDGTEESIRAVDHVMAVRHEASQTSLEGYAYSAMDADGRVWAYTDRPFLCEASWGTMGGPPVLIDHRFKVVAPEVWQNSLSPLAKGGKE